ncbi:MAG: carbohydrate ABC transporter permease, partial [Thermomicrobiales bacterium]
RVHAPWQRPVPCFLPSPSQKPDGEGGNGVVISAKAIREVAVVQRTRRARRRFVPYWFILPSLLVLGLFIAYPVGYSFWLSFHDYQWNMPAFGRPWVGLRNYTDIPSDRDLMHSVRWTVTFAAFSVPIGFTLGLVLALLLNSPFLGRARGLLRGVFLIPMMLAGVVAGFMWRMLFDPEYGPINHLLGLVGVTPVSWFGDPMAARAAVIVAELWLTTPFVMLVLLAGLQGIPEELHEAARIDGASAAQVFAHVTLPLLRSAIAIVLIIRTMDALRAFDQIFVLTGGGPGMSTTTVMYFDYLYAFSYYQMGRASAVSFAVLVAIALITAVYLAVIRRADRG